MIRFTAEQKEFLVNNNYLKTAPELANMFNNKFNSNIPPKEIINFRRRNKLKCGLTGRFEKDSIPHNKGKTWNDYMSKQSQLNSMKTTFKKGSIPSNHRNIGEERINQGGYIEIKISEPNTWKLKHRYIYEQHYGLIPKNYKVIFLDGNKNNFDISNLKAITQAEELIMNSLKLRYEDKELTESAYIIAQIESKRRKIVNERL